MSTQTNAQANAAPLMPKATAAWLVENTALTFEQISDFCRLHPLEVKGIADGEVAIGVKGQDPVVGGQLSREELERATRDPNHRLKLLVSKVRLPEVKRRAPRYTPLSRRQDRPNAILWLVRNHPELKDPQISRLVGTTKTTIAAIRERTHWNSSQLQPLDPVTLGLCSQMDLDMEVNRSAKDKPAPAAAPDTGATLLPAGTTAPRKGRDEAEADPFADMGPAPEREKEATYDAASVFAKLKPGKAG